MTDDSIIRIERIGPDFHEFETLLALVLRSFASMNGVIDPPSSALKLTVEGLKTKARDETAFVASDGAKLVGCVFLSPRADHLYLGKLAIDPDWQGRGLARMLVAAAEKLAGALELPAIELQTRIELTQNHTVFKRLGFVETGRSAHPGFHRPTSVTMRKQLR